MSTRSRAYPNASVRSAAPASRSVVSPTSVNSTSTALPSSGYQAGTTINISDPSILASPPDRLQLHSSFQGWAKNVDAAGIKLVIWTADRGQLLPLAALRESPRGSKEAHVDMTGEIVTFALDPKTSLGFKTDKIAGIRHYKHTHMLKASEDKLQYQPDGSKAWKDVKGDLFRFKGGSTMMTKTSEPYGTLFLADPLQEGANQSQWEVQNDKSVKITEQSRSKTIGSLAADPTVLGFSATGPIFLNDDPSNRGVQEFREYFYICTLLGTLIFPMDKPAWATKTLWWVKKLGGEAVGPALGAI